MQPRLDNATEPGAVVTVKWADQLITAVAESTAEEQSGCPSVAGDSIAESSNAESDESEATVAARRAQRVGPIAPQQGDPNIRRESSKWNNEPEVGNFGLFFRKLGTARHSWQRSLKKIAPRYPRSPNPEKPCASRCLGRSGQRNRGIVETTP